MGEGMGGMPGGMGVVSMPGGIPGMGGGGGGAARSMDM
jgi:hypothetical protein